MDRVLSVEETTKRIEQMQRKWGSPEKENVRLWAETLQGKFSSSGNQWAHKAGALPKRIAGQYAPSCTMWEDSAESLAKFEKWSEALRDLVGVKPRLNEEKQKGNNEMKFSEAACEAIIASAKVQSIAPWLAYVSELGGTITTTPSVVSTPASIEPEAEVASILRSGINGNRTN